VTRWVAAGVAAAAIVVAVVVFAVSRDSQTASPPASTTTVVSTTTAPAATTTTVTPTTTAAPGEDTSTAVWPIATGIRYDDPVALASAFASGYLGFEHPVVGTFRAGDSRSGEVEVRPETTGPATTVLVRELGSAWFVLGAATMGIDVAQPRAGADVSSPVLVAVQALTFEGAVAVEVRDDTGNVIGTGMVTGGGDILRPFSGRISFDHPATARGAIVFLTRSAKDGAVWQTAVVRIAFGGPPQSTETMVVSVYFIDDAGSAPTLRRVERVVPRSAAVLRSSLEALVVGPTAAEEAGGLSSWFSPATAGAVRSVVLQDGHAVIDFDDLRPVIPGASSSAGSARLLAELDATMFQFASVRSAEYRLLGSCEAFSEWLQYGGCDRRTRPGAAP
jgi:hypothetical protein